MTLELAVAPSVSSTIGQKKIATVKAEYGDVFGEGFTGVFCRELTITPIPAPKVTKTPEARAPSVPERRSHGRSATETPVRLAPSAAQIE